MSDAQQDLDDEILSACQDGELPPTEAEAVRRRLAREPQFAARLRAMQRADEAAAGAFRAPDRQPVPGRILELLQAAEAEHRQRRLETGNVVPMRLPVMHRRSRLPRWPAALAAGIALAAGFSLGALLPAGGSLPAGTFVGRSECEPDRGARLREGPPLPQVTQQHK